MCYPETAELILEIGPDHFNILDLGPGRANPAKLHKLIKFLFFSFSDDFHAAVWKVSDTTSDA